MTFSVRRLVPADVVDFRILRVEALKSDPTAFTSAPEEEADASDAVWESKLAMNNVFGVFDKGQLVGMAAYHAEDGPKLEHRGHLVGVYVRPSARGTGAARLMLEAVLDAARQHVTHLYLIVNASNTRAGRLYERLGFVEFGRDPGGLLVDGTLHEDRLMMLRLDEGSGK